MDAVQCSTVQCLTYPLHNMYSFSRFFFQWWARCSDAVTLVCLCGCCRCRRLACILFFLCNAIFCCSVNINGTTRSESQVFARNSHTYLLHAESAMIFVWYASSILRGSASITRRKKKCASNEHSQFRNNFFFSPFYLLNQIEFSMHVQMECCSTGFAENHVKLSNNKKTNGNRRPYEVYR